MQQGIGQLHIPTATISIAIMCYTRRLVDPDIFRCSCPQSSYIILALGTMLLNDETDRVHT